MLFLNDIVMNSRAARKRSASRRRMPRFHDDDRDSEKAFWNQAVHDELQAGCEDHRPRASST
jgi:hypothetical protein